MVVIFACSWIFLFAYSDLSLGNPQKNNNGSKEPVSHTVGIGVYTFPNLKYKLV